MRAAVPLVSVSVDHHLENKPLCVKSERVRDKGDLAQIEEELARGNSCASLVVVVLIDDIENRLLKQDMTGTCTHTR